MKCPKCGYLGFDSGDRCRNCGYDFSLVGPPAGHADAHAAPSVSPGAAPLRGAHLARGAGYRRASSTPGSAGADRPLSDLPEGTPVDLPLFGGEVPLPPPRAPLAVRRAAPTPPRVRSRTPTPAAGVVPLLGAASEAEPPVPAAGPQRTPDAQSMRASWAAATPGQRAAAAAIDLSLVALIDLVVLHFTLTLCGLTFGELRVLPWLPMAAFLLVLNGGYLVFFTGTLGQTFGKMAAAIEVVPDGLGKMDLRRSALRGGALAVSLLPAGLGWLAGLVGDRRGLHDRLAGTRVVRVAAD